VESADRKLTPLDELYLQRSYELAARGIGNTAPNPPVGAVVVRDGHPVGEGYHYRAGDAHAERNALAQAGANARGATLYVSLEPCRHVGRTPPCTQAVVDAGVVRVVAGAFDPSGHGGAAELRERGIQVTVAGDPFARDLIESFGRAVGSARPFVALKMAMSLDGAVASRPGVRERIGSAEEEGYVRDLRAASDAVMVGAGTIRVDDPQLTVRPPHDRVRPYVRVVAGARNPLDAASRVFASAAGYERTIVLVPATVSERFDGLRSVADVVAIDGPNDTELDLRAAMRALRERDIFSVLCEGGPRLAASMLAAGEVDRIYWAIAPRLLGGTNPVPVLAGATIAGIAVRFDRIERLGPDVMISGTVARV
jgi:diaminohydroxyphosphoribosylaminopyrimidine deaminase/5-amino-6-(5-phosphoribosylamino)uracil reductase